MGMAGSEVDLCYECQPDKVVAWNSQSQGTLNQQVMIHTAHTNKSVTCLLPAQLPAQGA
jgi:hypothetical protein